MLSKRLFSAAVLISLSLTLIWLDLNHQVRGQAGLWTLPMLAFFALGTIWEFSALLRRKWPVDPISVTRFGVIALLVSLFPIFYSVFTQKAYPIDCPVGRFGWVLIGMMTGVGCCGLQALLQFGRPASNHADEALADQERERTTLAWLLSSMVLCYVVSGVMVWQIIRMRGDAQGLYELIALLSIVKCADAGAFFAGKSFGRTKLLPGVSPGKTVEGLIGGCLAAMLVSVVAFGWAIPKLGVVYETGSTLYFYGALACFGLFLAIVGLVGDLLESMVKRGVGAKDSGNLLPGLGGVWDVTDSALPCSFVGYVGLIAIL